MSAEEVKVKPLHDRVLLRKIEKEWKPEEIVWVRDHPEFVDVVENMTDGRHGDYRRMPIMGVILAVGPGKRDKKFRLRPTTVKPGEVVIFTDWNDWESAPKGVYMVREADIWGYAAA